MRYREFSTALVGLHNWARQSTSKAIDYQMAFGVKSTLPKETLLENIALARLLIKEIEALCSHEQLVMLKFRYGWMDKFGEESWLDEIGRLAYPKNPAVGELIALNWRDSRISVYARVGQILDVRKSRAFEVIEEGRQNLETIRVRLLNTAVSPADAIEAMLIKQSMLIIPPGDKHLATKLI